MMPQMEANEPGQPQSSRSYAGYEADQGYTTPPYQPPASSTLDDNFVEAVSQRITRHMQKSSGKVYGKSREHIPADQRTGIAIVSVLAFVILAIVVNSQGIAAIPMLLLVGLVILLINFVANR